MKLLLGGGALANQDAISLDLVPGPHTITGDIRNTPWPFQDAAFDAVEAIHVLEHIPPETPDPLFAIFQEAARVLKPGGHFIIEYPDYRNPTAYHNPTHYRRFTGKTFKSLTGDYFVHGAPLVPFELVTCRRIPESRYGAVRLCRWRGPRIGKARFMEHLEVRMPWLRRFASKPYWRFVARKKGGASVS